MDDTSGFYKFDGVLLYGYDIIINKDYQLQRIDHNNYTYPVDGWYWFDTEQETRLYFGLPEPIEVDIKFKDETIVW